jgi:hypothetical protein
VPKLYAQSRCTYQYRCISSIALHFACRLLCICAYIDIHACVYVILFITIYCQALHCACHFTTVAHTSSTLRQLLAIQSSAVAVMAVSKESSRVAGVAVSVHFHSRTVRSYNTNPSFQANAYTLQRTQLHLCSLLEGACTLLCFSTDATHAVIAYVQLCSLTRSLQRNAWCTFVLAAT